MASSDSDVILACTPVIKASHELADDGRVVVLVPKFDSRWTRWINRHLRRPNLRLRLDAFGSFIWLHCDGKATVGELAEGLRKEFGDKAGQAEERTVAFFRQLARGGILELRQYLSTSRHGT